MRNTKILASFSRLVNSAVNPEVTPTFWSLANSERALPRPSTSASRKRVLLVSACSSSKPSRPVQTDGGRDNQSIRVSPVSRQFVSQQQQQQCFCRSLKEFDFPCRGGAVIFGFFLGGGGGTRKPAPGTDRQSRDRAEQRAAAVSR